MKNEPIFLRPTGKNYIWGGQRLNTEFNKKIDMDPLAETWECSTHPDGPSYAVGGAFDGMTLKEIISAHPEFLGTAHRGLNDLPILIKFIDAKNDLSVQVHPSDEYAAEFENGQLGKSEMWYIVDAGPDTEIVYGLKEKTSKEVFEKAISEGTLENLLNRTPVKKGDSFFIKSGTVHAICSGNLIAEIQENSNLTYRIYDYNRVGKDGKKRELHVKKALDVSILDRMPNGNAEAGTVEKHDGYTTSLLSSCEYFTVSETEINTEKPVDFTASAENYRILLSVDGCGTLLCEGNEYSLPQGTCVFIPADSARVSVSGKLRLLDIG